MAKCRWIYKFEAANGAATVDEVECVVFVFSFAFFPLLLVVD